MVLVLLLSSASVHRLTAEELTSRPRARELGLVTGTLEPGPHNAITDVEGVKVGHYTLRRPPRFNTGITAVLPHGGNLYEAKVPGAIVVGNGFGKLLGSTQVNELGEIETPILLTGTLNVPRVADALITFLLAYPGMGQVRSINPVVGETNDGYLSDIRARPLGLEAVEKAVLRAQGGPVALGAVGAGAGTVCFGFKGGIGSASRVLSEDQGGWTVGVLVQTNFGGPLRVSGLPEKIRDSPLGAYLRQEAHAQEPAEASPDGSLMIIVATDAPLDHRNLRRLAQRSLYGMARTGGYGSNGSGDYAIAFSADPESRIRRHPAIGPLPRTQPLDNTQVTGLFLAVTEATEEAILDSLFTAVATEGYQGSVPALPVERVVDLAGIERPR